jgi:hypothetical protein
MLLDGFFQKLYFISNVFNRQIFVGNQIEQILIFLGFVFELNFKRVNSFFEPFFVDLIQSYDILDLLILLPLPFL